MSRARHAMSCPSYGTADLSRCTCGAPGSRKSQQPSLAMTPGETLQAIALADPPQRPRTGSGYPGGGVERVRASWSIEAMSTTHDLIMEWVKTMSKLLGHPISLTSDRHGWTALQRCRACGGEIESKLSYPADQEPPPDMAAFGHSLRFDYQQHICEPVGVALHGCTVEELDTVLASVEVEVERVCGRYKAVEDELRRRQEAKRG